MGSEMCIRDRAVVARPKGERRVQLSAGLELQPAGHQMRIEVCDNGEGIDPEIRDQLFEPFFTTRTKGTGLGLAIVRQIAELQGGRVELNDNQPSGACVVLTLPLTPTVAEHPSAPDQSDSEEVQV